MEDTRPDDTRNIRVVVVPEAEYRAQLEAAAERGAARALAAMTAPRTRDLTSKELARALGIGTTTVVRATNEGLPYTTVGTKRRYDLEQARAWFAARGAKPIPVAPKKTEDDIDVSRALANGGLRRAR